MKKTLVGHEKENLFTVSDMQQNYCGECDCSCTCDGGCNGDTKKCTSKKALKKGCNHHCDCYIGPMVENFPKREPIQTHAKSTFEGGKNQ